MKRNDIVRWKKPSGEMYAFYGRISRIEGDKALWFCTGARPHLTPLSELELSTYRGKREWAHDYDESGRPIVIYYQTHKDGNYVYADEPDDEGLQFLRIEKFVRPARWLPMPNLRRLKRIASFYYGKEVWNLSGDSPLFKQMS